jgi:cation transport regulator ChaB
MSGEPELVDDEQDRDDEGDNHQAHDVASRLT